MLCGCGIVTHVGVGCALVCFGEFLRRSGFPGLWGVCGRTPAQRPQCYMSPRSELPANFASGSKHLSRQQIDRNRGPPDDGETD
jgi:hypothetical protein